MLAFFKRVDLPEPRGLSVHVVLDNLSAHIRTEVTEWLAHRRASAWHLHFAPTSSSWLNLVERWFAELTNRRLSAACSPASADSSKPSTCGPHSWNDDPKPFVWHKPAEEIIAKVRRGRAALHQVKSATDH